MSQHNPFSRRKFLESVSALGAAYALTGNNHLNAGISKHSKQLGIVKYKQKASDLAWQLYEAKSVDKIEGLLNLGSKVGERSKFGGDSSVSLPSTGFFRVEKLENKWVMVDPEGHPFFSVGLNSVLPKVKLDLNSPDERFKEVIGSNSDTLKFIKSIGFNTLGQWSKRSLGKSSQAAMPYVFYDFRKGDSKKRFSVSNFGLMGIFCEIQKIKESYHLFFDERFKEHCESFSGSLKDLRDDLYMVGYFSDNELHTPKLAYLANIPESKKSTFKGALNAAHAWCEFQGLKLEAITKFDQEIEMQWMAHCYDWYYSIVTPILRESAPNHLFLGARVFSGAVSNKHYYTTASKYLDVVAVHPYGMFEIPIPMIKQWNKWSGDKPVLISEFYVKGFDYELDNRYGAGGCVPTQEDRGAFYQNFVLNLLKSQVCVGWHWHRFMDDLKDNDSTNKGIVNVNGRPYYELIKKMKDLNQNVYSLA